MIYIPKSADKYQTPFYDRLKACRTITIRNIEQTMTAEMVYVFFEKINMKENIKGLMFNKRRNAVRVYINNPQKAHWFYDQCNFRERILLRPLNITLELQANRDEKTFYMIEGKITQQNQRTIFDTLRKYGICDLQTKYSCSGRINKLESKAVITLIRDQHLNYNKLKQMTMELKGMELKLYKILKLNQDQKQDEESQFQIDDFKTNEKTQDSEQAQEDSRFVAKKQKYKIKPGFAPRFARQKEDPPQRNHLNYQRRGGNKNHFKKAHYY